MTFVSSNQPDDDDDDGNSESDNEVRESRICMSELSLCT